MGGGGHDGGGGGVQGMCVCGIEIRMVQRGVSNKTFLAADLFLSSFML